MLLTSTCRGDDVTGTRGTRARASEIDHHGAGLFVVNPQARLGVHEGISSSSFFFFLKNSF